MIMGKICLISIVDNISTTSIPVNEFVVYRNKTRKGYRQIVFTRIPINNIEVDIPEDISVYSIPHSKREFRRLIRYILTECKEKGECAIFHLHHQKSALFFFFSSFLLGIRNRTLFTIHSYYSGRGILYRLSSSLCTLWAKCANCVSNAAYNDYPKWIRWIKGHRMMAIPNGIDIERIENALQHEGKYADICNINKMVCVDRMIPIKNQKFIVGLLRLLPDMELVLIGQEDQKQEIRDLASSLGVIERVTFTGLLKRDDVYKEINKCGLYVSASTVEGLHLSVLEAMRVGAIPIISDIPAHREIAMRCKQLIAPLPFIESVWVDKIKEYQQTDKEELRILSSKLKAVMKENFSLEKMHEAYDALYASMIQS